MWYVWLYPLNRCSHFSDHLNKLLLLKYNTSNFIENENLIPGDIIKAWRIIHLFPSLFIYIDTFLMKWSKEWNINFVINEAGYDR